MMEAVEKYKQTEVGLIPSDWEVKTIIDLALNKKELFDDGDWIESEHIQNQGIRLIQTGNIGIGNFLEKGIKKYINQQSFEMLRCKELMVGDLLICRLAEPAGRACIFPNTQDERTITSVDVTIFRPPTNIINREYLNQIFTSNNWLSSVSENSGGTTHKRISRGKLGKLKIATPTLTEQTLIATALSDADALISSLEKLLTKKRNIKQGAMQKLLQPKEGWKVKKLGEVATVVRGASPRPIEDPKWFDENSSIGWVRISDVTKSVKILTETTQKLSELGIQSSRYVDEGNLIMSICATVGRPILTRMNVCIHDGFVVFRNPQVEINYLYYFLSFIEKDWSKNGQTGSQMNLNTTLINTTEIPIPKSKEEQTRIATILSDMDAEITALETKLEKYKMVKLGMMQNLLTGRIRLV